MTDKNKTIQEALAEVQRLQEQKFYEEVFKILEQEGIRKDTLDEALIADVIKFGAGTAKTVGHKALDAANYIKGKLTGRGSSTITTPNGRTIRQANPPTPKSNVPATTQPSSGRGKAAAAGALHGFAAGSGYVLGQGLAKSQKGSEASSSTTTDSSSGDKSTVEPAKPDSSTNKKSQTFGQAFAAARKAASEKGSKSTGQFEYQGKQYQTNVKGEKYVPMSKQTKVASEPTTSTSKIEAPKPQEPKYIPTELSPAKVETGFTTPSTDPTTTFKKQKGPIGPSPDTFSLESGGKLKGKRNMSEENINELSPFEKTFAQKMKQLGPGKTYRDPNTGKNILLKYADNKPQAGSKSTSKGPQDNPGLRSANPQFLRPRTPNSSISPGNSADPAKIDYSKDNKGKPPTLPSVTRDSAADPARNVQRLPDGGEKGIGTPGGSLSLERPSQTPKPSTSTSDSSLVSNRPRFNQPGGSSDASSSDFVRRQLGQSPMASETRPARPVQSTTVKDTGTVGLPTNKFSAESGGKKKMSEEATNSLIASFLKLQETKAGNMFEAAKKAKKDWDKDGKIESDKDEVWGSRFRAAKAAGKMEEASVYDKKNPFDPKDPSVQGSGDVTSSAPKHVRPTNPERIKNLKDPRDSSVQGSGDVTMDGKPARVKEDMDLAQVKKGSEGHPGVYHYGVDTKSTFDRMRSGKKAVDPHATEIKKTNESIYLEDFVEYHLEEGYDIYDIVDFLEENYQLDEISQHKVKEYIATAKAKRTASHKAADDEREQKGSAYWRKHKEYKKLGRLNNPIHQQKLNKMRDEYDTSFKKERSADRKLKATDERIAKAAKLVKDDVEFSDAEIARLNAIMEAGVSPEPAEENMDNSPSTKLERKTLTDSKKVK